MSSRFFIFKGRCFALTLLLFVQGISGYAQTKEVMDVLHKMVKIYNNDATYSTSMEINYFVPYNSNKLTDTMSVFMVRSKTGLYYKLRDREVICHDGYYLEINNQDHHLVLGQQGSDANPDKALFGIQMIDSMAASFHATGSVTVNSPVSNTLTLLLPGSTMPEVKVTYDPKTFYVKKSVIKYVEDVNLTTLQPTSFARVEVIYNSTRKSEGSFLSKKYPFSKYFTLKGKEVNLTAAYKNYTLNNFLK